MIKGNCIPALKRSMELRGFHRLGHCSSLELLVKKFALWRLKPHGGSTFAVGIFA